MVGRMAEWSIAAVLKTAGLTAPGVRIPLLPVRRQKALVCMVGVSYGKCRSWQVSPRLNSNVGSVRQLLEAS